MTRTSRTSRPNRHQWRQVANRRRAIAQTEGITHCPTCRVKLDYHNMQRPNSAEADHILPHSLGGSNDIENTQILCRRCNQSQGNRTDATRRSKRTTIPTIDFTKHQPPNATT